MRGVEGNYGKEISGKGRIMGRELLVRRMREEKSESVCI